jgi:hypothetical protein
MWITLDMIGEVLGDNLIWMVPPLGMLVAVADEDGIFGGDDVHELFML